VTATVPARPKLTGDQAADSLANLYQPINWYDLWAHTSSEPDWLVPGIIERGRLHAIYAPKKHKKSLLTLVMVAALVTGRPLLGRPNPHGRAVRVLYIDIENSRDDIRQRLHDAGYGPDDLTDLPYYSFPSLPGLDSAAGGTHLLALIERQQPELVVLDTTSRVVTGKENDADTFRSLYRHTLAPIKALGLAVLRLDNAGKDPTLGQRGSSAKGDDLDTAWLVTMQGEDRITLRLDFQRSNHHPPQIELVRYLDPLRFVRLDHAADRPEITALCDHLDRLGVPQDAGRPAARTALNGAKIKAADRLLEEAIKMRKSCAQDQRAVTSASDLVEIDYSCADAYAPNTISAAQSYAAQDSRSSRSGPGSSTAGAARDLPASRSAQVSRSTPQDCAPSAAAHPTAGEAEDEQCCITCGQPILLPGIEGPTQCELCRTAAPSRDRRKRNDVPPK
jgi:hypothetical protein